MALANRLWNDLSGGAPDNDLSGAGLTFLQRYQAILGANLVAFWHSQLGIVTIGGAVDTWTDQIGGRVISAPAPANRPPYAPDGLAMGGKSVPQSANAGGLCLTSATLASICAAGTRPCIIARGRWRGLAPGFQTFFDVGDAAGAGLRIRADGAIISSQASFVTVAASSVATIDNAVHTGSAWTDGANANYQLDGVLAQAATTGDALPNNMVAVTVGSNTARTLGSQFSCAFAMVLTSYPGAAALAQVEALAAEEFPPTPTYASILGPYLKGLWDAQLGITTVSGAVDTWTDQIGGNVLLAPGPTQRPVYGPDGAFFGGKNVVQCAVTGVKCLWANGTLHGLATAGDLPMIIVRFRMRSTTGTQRIVGFGGASGRSLESVITSGAFKAGDISTLTISTNVVADTVVHTSESWIDGTLFQAKIDAAGNSAAYTQTIQSDAIFGGFGVFCENGSTAPGDVCLAKVLFLSGYPGAAALAQVEAMLIAEYPA